MMRVTKRDRQGIGREVRLMLKNELADAWADGDDVLLIGHSLGSVIAYDTLWDLSHEEPEAGVVDLFMTLGSPLATRFIRHRLRGVFGDRRAALAQRLHHGDVFVELEGPAGRLRGHVIGVMDNVEQLGLRSEK